MSVRLAAYHSNGRPVTGPVTFVGSPVPAFAVTAKAFADPIEAGRGDLDHAALFTLLKDAAGV